ncbi:MAG: enoyl-CoA hydratase [Gemmatimonadetes bacterium]|nr:enoyl-CoA hydratase [Gemmatimonadota bacterium]
MTDSLLLVSVTDRVATVTINRPDKLNALNAAVFDALATTFPALEARADVGAVVLTGAGRAFVAGADIAELATLDPSALEALSLRGQAVMRGIERLKKPVIAAVNGFALGGGCELALCCHVRVASTKASFGLPECKLGLIPGYGGTQRLPRLIGRGNALKLLLTGAAVDGAEAYRLGLAQALAEPDALLGTATALATTMLSNGPLALAAAITTVDAGLDLPLDASLAAEARAFGALANTADMREGTRAFMEKRPAQFRGA